GRATAGGQRQLAAARRADPALAGGALLPRPADPGEHGLGDRNRRAACVRDSALRGGAAGSAVSLGTVAVHSRWRTLRTMTGRNRCTVRHIALARRGS